MTKLFTLSKSLHGLFDRDVRKAQQILRLGNHSTFEELNKFRDNAFRNLVRYVYNHVPYYKQIMNERKFGPEDIRTINDIELFPILTKDRVREAGKSLLSDELDNMRYIIRRSGGTTGEPIPSYINKLASSLETYSFYRGLEWMGWKPEYVKFSFGGGSLGMQHNETLLAKLKNKATKSVSIPAFEIKPETFYYYYNIISKAGDCILIGYASSLKYLSDLTSAHKLKLTNVKAVCPTSELIPDYWVDSISKTFGCQVLSYYGCGEVNSLGYQQEQLGPYIIPSEHVHLESTREDNDSGLQPYSLLITSFFNYAQPLIRYANGDMGTVLPGNELSGKYPRIKELTGRSADLFKKKDGSYLSSIFGTYLIQKTLIRVKRHQIIQHSMDYIEFRYEPLDDDITEENKTLLISKIQEYMNADIHVELTKTTNFILTKGGKHRIMICNI